MGEVSHTWIVDGIEDDVARVEEDGGRVLHVPRWQLPAGAREGDVLAAVLTVGEESASLTLRLDRAATEEARSRAGEQVARLRARDPGGDIVL